MYEFVGKIVRILEEKKQEKIEEFSKEQQYAWEMGIDDAILAIQLLEVEYNHHRNRIAEEAHEWGMTVSGNW